MKNIIEKLKSPVVWTTLAALIFFIAKEWCGYEIPSWDRFVELVLALAVAFGIVNNPNSRNTF